MISIVIPAYNEEKNIGDCLTSLVNQQTSKKFRVIVVDNNSTDKTAQKAKSFSKNLDMTIIFEKRKGRGTARKTGFDYSTDEIIFSTDADTILPTNWIEKLYSELVKSNGVAVSGTCRIIDCNAITNKAFNIMQPLAMKVYKGIFGHYWLSGFSFAIYKKIYSKSGGFNPELNALEDIDLSLKISKIGEIIFLKDIPVIFSGRRFKSGLIKGSLPYLTTFLKYFFLKKDDVKITDPR